MFFHFSEIVPEPSKNNMKCGPDGSSLRVFDLRNSKATENECRKKCMDNDQCVAYSARWNEWCIGCKVELDEPTINSEDENAIAYKKIGIDLN